MTVDQKINKSNLFAAAQNKILKEKSAHFTALGIILIAIGLLAIIFPFVTALAVNLIIGGMCIVAGLFTLTHAGLARGWAGFTLELVMSILYIGVGLYLVLYPIKGVFTITVVLASLLVVQGIIKILMAIRLRSIDGWIWALLSGVVSLLLGFMILSSFPNAALWTLGLYVGIDLSLLGWSMVMLSVSVRQGEKALKHGPHI